jgi:ABC-type histidine transport system ATPase subunit
MDASNPAVEARNLVKLFGDTRAVDGVSLSVPAGTIYGILGPQWRRQDDLPPHAARHHRPLVR